MNRIPLALCLFTSTRGHFDIKTRYLETLDDLNRQIPLSQFAGRFASVTVSPDEQEYGEVMRGELDKRGFTWSFGTRTWSHGTQSHQTGYLDSIFGMYNHPAILENEYALHAEDDWLYHSFSGDLLRHFAKAIEILRKNPDVMTVRFPRFANERERILGLRAKHGIDGKAGEIRDGWFRCNDFSLNPCVVRTRDFKIASDLFQRGGHALQPHVEHGFGALVKYLSRDEMPLAVLDPATVKVCHRGTKPGEEDSITEPVYAS